EERVADRARVVRVLGELKRTLDVLARGLVVAHPTPATRAPREDVRAERVGRHARALGEPECLVQQPERRLHAVELVPADAERVEDLGALEIGEVSGLDDPAGVVQQLERRAERAQPHLRPARTEECANLDLRDAGRARRGHERLVLGGRVLVSVRFDQGLGARESSLEPAALVGGDAVREESRITPEPRGEPVDRLRRRAGPPPLDLRDVLLREAVAGELALSQPGGNAKLAKPLPESEGGRRGVAAESGISGHAAGRSEAYASLKRKLSPRAIPQKGHKQAVEPVN